MSVVVKYDSNNSGGSWWLSLKDWEALAEAGWNVHWCDSRGRPSSSYEEPLKPCPKIDGAEWLGAPACSAAKEFDEDEDGRSHYTSVKVTETSIDFA